MEASRRKLKDEPMDGEPSDTEQTLQLSGSLEILDISPDLEAKVPQTRARATRVRRTQAQADTLSQF